MNRIDRNKTLRNFGALIRQRAKADHSAPEDPWDVVREIAAADPSRNNKYTFWMIRTWLRGGIRHLEDLPRASHALRALDRFKRHLPEEWRDINRYKKLGDLEDVVDPLLGQRTAREMKAEERVRAREESEILYEGPEGIVVIPRSELASCYWGMGTRWCTAYTEAENSFQHYNKMGPLYILAHRDGRKWQLHFEADQYMDERDNSLGEDAFRGEPLWQRFMEAARDRLLQDPFVALEVAILNKGFPEAEDVISQSPLASLCYAEAVLGGRFRKGEATILTDPRASARYAATVLEGRWKEAEAVISQNADASISYAEDALRGRFLMGEPVISRLGFEAAYYAENVLKRRWPEAEEAIMQETYARVRYAERVLKRPWPEAEDLIATDAYESLHYVREVLHRPFPKGEAAIAARPRLAVSYAREVLGGRFPEGEAAIARDPGSALAYARDVLKGRFVEAEEFILDSPMRDKYLDLFPEATTVLQDKDDAALPRGPAI